MFQITPSPYLFFPSFPRLLIDDTPGSEFAVEFGVEALTTLFDVKTLTALLTKACLVFLTDGNGLSVRMLSALHRSSLQ